MELFGVSGASAKAKEVFKRILPSALVVTPKRRQEHDAEVQKADKVTAIAASNGARDKMHKKRRKISALVDGGFSTDEEGLEEPISRDTT
jgi:hypothetical protein